MDCLTKVKPTKTMTDPLDVLIAMVEDRMPPQEGEFTIDDWLERQGLPNTKNERQTAARELDRLNGKGLVKIRKGKHKNKICNIYAYNENAV